MKKQKKSQTKKLLIICLALILVAGCTFAYLKRRSDNQRRAQQAADQAQETVNLAPATDEEKQTSEDNKQNLPENTPVTPDPDTGGLKQVAVAITSAPDDSTIRAQVAGIVEDGGICTATFTKGSTSFSKPSDSIANVSYTQCGPMRPDAGTLTSGSWQVVVSYKSNTAEGTSAPQTITVP